MRLILPAICLLLLFSCHKSDSNNKPDPPPAPLMLSLSATEATPGDAITIRVNKSTLAGQASIALGSSSVTSYLQGDTAYAFIVPVMSPGSISVTIPSITGANTLNLKIASYTAIANPQSVITDFIDNRNKSIDSITHPPLISGFQTAPETITLLNQLKDEMDGQLANLSAGEKELLAYVLQKNAPDPSAFSMNLLDASYYARTSGVQGDVGDRLVTIAKTYVTAQTVCLATIPFMVASGTALLVAPNPFAAAVFIGAFTTFVISRDVAIRRAQEVGRLKGVAEAIIDADAQKFMAVNFINNQEKALSMSVSFRNLAPTDAGIQPDVAFAFSAEQKFTGKDKEIESLYSKIKAALWFTKLSAAYKTYVAAIGKIPQATTKLPIDGNNILIKGVSDGRISYTTSVSGTTRSVKISSTATSQINFNLTVAYKRTLDGKEVIKDIACIFNNARTGVTIAGGAGTGEAANQIYGPIGLSFDGPGNMYIVDHFNNRVQKWAPGASSGVTVAGGNGAGSAANQLYSPIGMFVTGSGTLYIVDPGGERVQKWTAGASSGVTVAGGNGYGSAANQFDSPIDVFVDGSGFIYVSDLYNDRVQKWAPGASSGVTVAGGKGRGSASNQFYYPRGLHVDGSGNIYIVDSYNHRVQKWAPGASSAVTVAGGNGQGAGDNQLNIPQDVFVDASGNIYIADAGNARIQRWAPGASSGVTVAGGNGRGGAANQLDAPQYVFVDGTGTIFIADYGNNRVQKWPAY